MIAAAAVATTATGAAAVAVAGAGAVASGGSGSGPVCGNTLVEGDETCDDGNALSGDGCSAGCSVEPWDCWPAESCMFMVLVCGDGIRDVGEICDDGNAIDGDGCSADCTEIGRGFLCLAPGQPCELVRYCGDGRVRDGETCEDGNSERGDGCDEDCQIESGWLCVTVGEPCQRAPRCSDGVVSPVLGERCDDGNEVDGDGCAANCGYVEDGWECPSPGSECVEDRSRRPAVMACCSPQRPATMAKTSTCTALAVPHGARSRRFAATVTLRPSSAKRATTVLTTGAMAGARAVASLLPSVGTESWTAMPMSSATMASTAVRTAPARPGASSLPVAATAHCRTIGERTATMVTTSLVTAAVRLAALMTTVATGLWTRRSVRSATTGKTTVAMGSVPRVAWSLPVAVTVLETTMTKLLVQGLLLAVAFATMGCGSSGDDASGTREDGGNAGTGGAAGTGLGGSAAGPTVAANSGCSDALEPLSPRGTVETVGDGTADSCTEESLKAAVASLSASDEGGTVVFDCGEAEHAITLSSGIEVDGKLMLDGNGTITLSGGEVTRILNLNNYSELVVQRLVLRDGYTDESGGAILHPWYGTLHVIDVTFANNHAAQSEGEIGGGAIFAGGLSAVVISGSVFTGNSASNGGAILNRGSTLTIVDTEFRDNEATSYNEDGGQYGNGGGLYIDGMAYEDVGPAGDFHLCGSVFVNNGAKQHGSALFGYFYQGSTAHIDRCVFDQNSFAGSPAGSGGLYHGAVPLYLSNSTFSNNTALQGHGAAIQMESSAGTVVHALSSTFYGNEAQGNAGAVFASNSPLFATNCTFAQNKADYAPAIFKGESGSVTLSNTIFSNNLTDNEYSAASCHESFEDGGGNIQWPRAKNNGNDDTPCTPGILFADPLLGELGDNSGPTPTMAPGEGSPAIDLGADCPDTDQTGAARVGNCDAGAVEYH